jgi:23S rRNA pseudouridine2605 synthase
MKERLQKILSAQGICSRRAAEAYLLAGRIKVNGQVATLGDQADWELDEILVDDQPLTGKPDPIYIMLNKPRGYVTTLSDEAGRKTVADLVADCEARVYPVGRLDFDSEGLLLLTNDGEFANILMHPKHEVEKTYLAWVEGYSEEKLQRLKHPIVLDGYRIRPPKVQKIKPGLLEITIHEGRNRQVRRMCAAAGMRVKRLIRIREGTLSLGDLSAGQWRYLTPKEIEMII